MLLLVLLLLLLLSLLLFFFLLPPTAQLKCFAPSNIATLECDARSLQKHETESAWVRRANQCANSNNLLRGRGGDASLSSRIALHGSRQSARACSIRTRHGESARGRERAFTWAAAGSDAFVPHQCEPWFAVAAPSHRQQHFQGIIAFALAGWAGSANTLCKCHGFILFTSLIILHNMRRRKKKAEVVS